MEVVFRDKHLDLLEIDVSFDAGYPPGIIKSFRRRMQQIRAARDERDFMNLTSLRFEKLKGNRSHQYSMRLNDQWRLIMEFEKEGPARAVIIIGIEDYH